MIILYVSTYVAPHFEKNPINNIIVTWLFHFCTIFAQLNKKLARLEKLNRFISTSFAA